ncbi:MAG: DUF2844 domain-containing protein [Leptospirillia bacterium]
MAHHRDPWRPPRSPSLPALAGEDRSPPGLLRKSRRLLAGSVLFLGFALLPERAGAAIGQPFSLQEATELGYPHVATASLPGSLTAYTLSRTVTNPLGHTVTERIREVAGPNGRIFALSWSGIHPPDLGRLLGGRLPSPLPFVRGPRILSQPNLELRMAGSVLHAEGSAWDPRRIPPGTNLPALLDLP